MDTNRLWAKALDAAIEKLRARVATLEGQNAGSRLDTLESWKSTYDVKTFRYAVNAAQAVAAGATVTVQWSDVPSNVETLSGVWSSGNSTRIILPTAGFWSITGVLRFQGGGTAGDNRQAQLRKNAGGNVANGTRLMIATGGSNGGSATFTPFVYQGTFAANDYVELFASHGSGISLNVDTVDTWIAAELRRP